MTAPDPWPVFDWATEAVSTQVGGNVVRFGWQLDIPNVISGLTAPTHHAEALYQLNKHNASTGKTNWYDLFTKEIAEVTRSACNTDDARLRDELIDVAAVCVQWIIALETNATTTEKETL